MKRWTQKIRHWFKRDTYDIEKPDELNKLLCDVIEAAAEQISERCKEVAIIDYMKADISGEQLASDIKAANNLELSLTCKFDGVEYEMARHRVDHE